ncbi:MAG: FHA domain-containing protein [Myxococcales bacterium]|nr:FHA domain-containing protein [Myxococcales bacterium]
MFTLVIEDKRGDVADEYAFEAGNFVIGRSRKNDIILPSENVSREHARLFTREDRCFIVDLESANGVFVNGKRISGEVELAPSSQIKIGDFYLHVDKKGDGEPRSVSDEVFGRLHGKNLGVAGRNYPLTERINLIGRGRDCTTTIIDSSVSRNHAQITVDEVGNLFLRDLRSANGTFVDGRRVDMEPVPLRDRSKIKLGNVELVLEIQPMETVVRDSPRGAVHTAIVASSPDVSRAPSHAEIAETVDDVNQEDLAPTRKKLMAVAGVIAFLGVAGLVTLYLWPSPELPPPADPTTVVSLVPKTKNEPEIRRESAQQDKKNGENTSATQRNHDNGENGRKQNATDVGVTRRSTTTQSKNTKTQPALDEEKLRNEAEHLISERKWALAAEKIAVLRKIDPFSTLYTSLANQAKLEMQNETWFAQAQNDDAKHMYGEARQSLAKITVDSVYREAAQLKIRKLLEDKQARIHEGDEKCKRRQWSACYDLYTDALAYDPSDNLLREKQEFARKKARK